MPIIGHLAEAGIVIHEEFREGNTAPSSKNLEFIKACEMHLPKGHRIASIRMDAANYQASIFNYCEESGKTFAIGGRLDGAMRKTIEAIPETSWQSCGGKNFCVNGHFAGNCYYFSRRRNDCKQRINRQAAGRLQETRGLDR